MCGSQEHLLAIIVGFKKANSMIRLPPISMSSCQMEQEGTLASMQDMLSSIFTIILDRSQVKSGDKYLITIFTNAE
jgi:hypothetical protein